MSIRVGVVRLCLKGVPRVHAVIYIYATKEQKEHKMVLTITKKKSGGQRRKQGWAIRRIHIEKTKKDCLNCLERWWKVVRQQSLESNYSGIGFLTTRSPPLISTRTLVNKKCFSKRSMRQSA